MLPARTAGLYLATGFGASGRVRCSSCRRFSGFDSTFISFADGSEGVSDDSPVIRAGGGGVKRPSARRRKNRGAALNKDRGLTVRNAPSWAASKGERWSGSDSHAGDHHEGDLRGRLFLGCRGDVPACQGGDRDGGRLRR